jgi:hypothetical protein
MRILVGTWGTGPFDSDAAEDYVDALERMSALQRLGALEEIFGRAAMAADDSWRQPGELIAAAALVAANMPLGTSLSLELTTPGEVAAHRAQPGYDAVTMCTYALPRC